MLHCVAVTPRPARADELGPPEAGDPDGLLHLLSAQWHGLLPGVHRLGFDDGHVLLTLCIGDLRPMLRAQHFDAEEIVVDAATSPGNDPVSGAATVAPLDPVDLSKALARFARPGTRITVPAPAAALHAALESQGFRLRRPDGAPTYSGDFAPAWTVRRHPAMVATPGHCVVVGAGLAGAAVAASLARRGWRVTVLDAGAQAASGASGVPAGVFAPHVSSDDALLSRLTRAGLRLTWQQLATHLREGTDWRGGGVLERRAPGDDRLPAGWHADGPNASWRATADRLIDQGLAVDTTALWHEHAGWARPARLVAAWLARPGISLRTRARVARIERAGEPPCWTVLDADGRCLAAADRVVVAAGFESTALAGEQPLHRVRGQLAWGRMDLAAGLADVLPTAPLNGDGHLIAHVPDADGAFWLTGATFDRGRDDTATSTVDTEANLARLARLHPGAHALLRPDPTTGRTRPEDPARSVGRAGGGGPDAGRTLRAWAGVRCASADRRPLVGPLHADAPDGPWLCTAMGSRGLSFAVLCAELLAARWHGEPLPLPAGLAQALDTARTTRPPRANGRPGATLTR